MWDLNRTPIIIAKHGSPVSIFQESPHVGEPRERLFHIHSVNCYQLCTKYIYPSTLLWQTSTGIDADACKGETSPGYFNSKLVYSYKCGTIFPWEFPEISLAYSHIFLKGPSRSLIYGQIFWPPHPHPHIANPASIYHQNQLSLGFRFSFNLIIHFENAGNICNKYDL